jgi:hypothetical protein
MRMLAWSLREEQSMEPEGAEHPNCHFELNFHLKMLCGQSILITSNNIQKSLKTLE